MQARALRFSILLAALATACAGTLEDPSRFQLDAAVETNDASATDATAAACPDVVNLLATSCAGLGCHSYADKSRGIDLESPNVAGRLVGVCALSGGYLVDPANPEKSLIYTKLLATPPSGGRMPPGTPFDDPTTACVLTWIRAQPGTANGCGGDAGASSDARSSDAALAD